MGLIALATVIDVAARYVPAVQAVQHGRDEVTQAEALLTGDLAHLNQARLDQARGLFVDAQQDFGPQSAVLASGWIGGVIGHLPFLDKQIQAARLIRIAGQDGAVAATDVVDLLKQLAPNAPSAQPLSQRLALLAQDRKADLIALSTKLADLQADVAALPDGMLLGPLDSARNTLRTQGAKVLAAAPPAIGLLQALPAAIGRGQHTYLILLENPGEMRPGGGYIGAVGQVTFSGGALTSETFRDSTFSDPLVRNIQSPRPFDVYLQHGAPWNMADADWSPDFPTAVADVERFYVAATGVHPDGVIAVDPVALGGILAITGPIRVPSYPQVITSANALTELNYITNHARPGDPGKVFLPPFGQAVVDRLLHATVGQAPGIASSLQRSAKQKHVEVYFTDRHVEDLVRGAGFDGGVRTPLGDALEVLDANLSGTKADLYVSRSLDLQVMVGDDGQAHDRLAISYRNPVPSTPAARALETTSGGDYRDYLQVLVPETAQFDTLMVSVNGGKAREVAPEAITYVFQRQDIAYWLIVPKGGSATVTMTYEGPFADISRSPTAYALNWERQNGALTWSISLSVAMPRSITRRWNTDLSVDRAWSLTGGS
ncbi:MAG: DUF4012 domain-containing protein [Candidatus Dormibacteraeota bacterium]|uniref:DUF4012 domain-containing protein n=1 Tax=Candidatus Aeolococcus gillhamiae TaxID=3127015 RepID=A0A934JY79_9BACT|nr:DUF4012 domain-containing protein [Candidatus Dormibacteraeota bacterium]